VAGLWRLALRIRTRRQPVFSVWSVNPDEAAEFIDRASPDASAIRFVADGLSRSSRCDALIVLLPLPMDRDDLARTQQAAYEFLACLERHLPRVGIAVPFPVALCWQPRGASWTEATGVARDLATAAEQGRVEFARHPTCVRPPVTNPRPWIGPLRQAVDWHLPAALNVSLATTAPLAVVAWLAARLRVPMLRRTA